MRPLHLCALLVGVAVAGTACGGDNGPSNTAPTAAFTPSCTLLACTFTSTSSDPEGDALTYQWNFGEPSSGTNNTSTAQSPSHTYAAAGSFHVTLTVTDANGAASGVADSLVTVSAGAANQPPTASFTVTCNGEDCTFTDGSSDPEGGALTYDWDFGDGSAHGTDQSPAHTYTVTAVTPFTVTLIVTDDQGATGTTSQSITVTPPAGLQCSGVNCTLDITQRATLTITLVSSDCQLGGNRFSITAPIKQTVFFNGCSVTDGTVFTINGPNLDKSFDAGTQLEAEFTQGVGKPEDPPRGSPAIRLTGTYPQWMINIDDGGNPTGPGEPDFNDLILQVDATAAP